MTHTTHTPPTGERLAAAAMEMLQALIVAREFISTERNGFLDAAIDDNNLLDQRDETILADYDEALLVVNSAIRKATVTTPCEQVAA